MDYELAAIGKLRRKLGLTQKQLAKLSSVSQSLIAKIESGKIDPAYSKVKKIIRALEIEQSKKESNKKVSQLMSKNIFSLSPKDPVGAAINLMKRKDISQIPIIENGISVGSISENIIVESISEFGDDLATITIERIMDEAFPTIPPYSEVEAASGLLKYYKAILVREKGKLIGIITKADLLKAFER